MPPGNRSVDRQDALANLDGDVEALVFATMMEAAKSAQEDLKTIMAGVKAINAAKRRLRELLCAMNRDVVAATVAELEHRAFAFSPHGLGGDRAYRRVDFPVPDPESSGGVQVAVVSFADSKITSRAQLEAAVDAVKNRLDSMSELSEMESLRLQLAMDRLSKLMATLSNLLKKISDTGDDITQNIK